MKKRTCIFLIIIIVFTLSLFVFIKKDLLSYLTINDVRSEIAITNAYDNNDATHPKVVKFDNPWNGYKYWLTFTPLYKGDDQTENPHILVSNDLINWKIKEGATNPIEDKPVGGKIYNVYYSDPVLVYNNDDNELECWFRYSNKATKEVIIYRKTTKDGITYTDKEIAMSSNHSINDILSPAVIYEDGKYKIWYVSIKNGKNIVLYTETTNLTNFSDPQEISIQYKNDNLITWHIDVSESNSIYHMLISAYEVGGNPTKGMRLYYSSSLDNKNYDEAEEILVPRVLSKEFDNQTIYKSSLIYDDDKYLVLYSSTSSKNDHRLGIVNKDGTIKKHSNNHHKIKESSSLEEELPKSSRKLKK